jgi:malate dehydrogenase
MKSLVYPTAAGQWFSSGICSDNNPYGIEENLVFSFPCRLTSDGEYQIVKDIPWDSFLKAKIKATEQELLEERQLTINMVR